MIPCSAGLGADSLDGGAGFDFARYDAAAAGVTARLDLPGLNTGEAAGDAFFFIEGLVGSGFSDVLIGDAGTNVIYGGAGADVIAGLGGSDTLTGDAGADIFDLRSDVQAGAVDTVTDLAFGIDRARLPAALAGTVAFTANATGTAATVAVPGGTYTIDLIASPRPRPPPASTSCEAIR
jgi:serralysin